MTTPLFRDYVLVPKEATEDLQCAFFVHLYGENVKRLFYRWKKHGPDTGESKAMMDRSAELAEAATNAMLSARPTTEIEAAVEEVIEAARELRDAGVLTCVALTASFSKGEYVCSCERCELERASARLDALMETKG